MMLKIFDFLLVFFSSSQTFECTKVTALSGLAKEGYVSDTLTVGLIRSDGEESEVYAPKVLEPGMYSLKEAYDEE